MFKIKLHILLDSPNGEIEDSTKSMELSHGLLSGGMNKLIVSKFHKPPPVAKRTSSIPRMGKSKISYAEIADSTKLMQSISTKSISTFRLCKLNLLIYLFVLISNRALFTPVATSKAASPE